MKKIFLFLLFGLLIGLSVACNKDDDNNDGPFMTATVGTTNFTASSISASVLSNVLTVSGISSNSGISFTLPVGATGQQNISLTSAPITATYTENSVGYMGYTGNITVSEWDTANKTVTGTFSFSAQIVTTGAQKDITAGEFSATYQ